LGFLGNFLMLDYNKIRQYLELPMSGSGRKKPRKRLTIGYLTHWIGPGDRTMWPGIHDTACEHDVNVICFPAGQLRTPHQFEQRDVIYDLISAEKLDGLILRSEGLAAYTSPEKFEAIYQQYRPLPMVSVARPLPDVPSILVDNAQGMRSAITHLIERHGYQCIAFIRGPESHQEAEQRYCTYVDVLDEYDLPFDPDLVVAGDFTEESGARAARLLLDRRKLLRGEGFRAIVAANDSMALGALKVLQARGVRVPDQVALVGFDDRYESGYTIPALTTVQNPFYKLGAKATEILLAHIDGRDVPGCTVLPLDLVVRQSCGCPLATMVQATADPVMHHAEERGEVLSLLSARREDILVGLTESSDVSITSQRAERLLDAFIAHLEKGGDDFFSTLEDILREVVTSDADAFIWQDVLSRLRRQTLLHLDYADARRAEAVLDQARIVIGDIARRQEGHRAVLAVKRAQRLQRLNFALTADLDLAELLNVAAQEIPKTGILNCYLSLFENPERPLDRSRLVLALDGGERLDLGPEERFFPSWQLVPDGLLSPDRRYSLVFEPLYFHDRQLGFVLFGVEPSQEEACDVLQNQISSALQSVLLLEAWAEADAALEKAYAEVEEQVKKRTAELEQEIADREQAEVERERVEKALKHRLEQLAALSQASQAVTASLEPNQVLAEIVSLANEVVDTDYTGVVLVDETGHIGQTAENLPGIEALKYRVRDGGFTSWIVRLRRAVVIDEVGADGTVYPSLGEGAPRKANPIIVQARVKSFAGLPLMVKDRLLGVIYLHSLHPRAFGGQLFLLTAFANQVAIALENARLFQAEQQQTQRLALLVDVARIAATTFDADALLQAVAESICRHYDYPRVGLFTLDEAEQTLILRGRSSEMVTLNELAVPGSYRLKTNQGISGYVARTGEPHLAPDVSNNPYFVNPTKVPTQSALGVPILEGEAAVGTIIIESDQPASFDREDQSLLEAVSSAVAIGLRNARLYQETQRRVQELTLLNSIALLKPGTTLDTDAPIKSALEGLHLLTEVDHIVFFSIDPGAHTWKVTHERSAPGVDSIADLGGTFDAMPPELAALLEDRPFAVSDTATDPRLEAGREFYHSLKIKSMLLMPVQSSGRFYGALGFGNCHENRTWQAEEVRLLEAVARQLGLVLENAYLFVETQQRAEELASALVQLEEMDQLKDTFIQNVSHELRSPLALVRGYAEMLDAGELGEIPAEQQKPVAIIARRARMLSDLVKDITLILEAEVSRPEPEPIPLDELARNAVEDFQVEIEQAGLVLEADIEPGLPPVSGTLNYMRRVLDNLIGNAVKFTPAGGKITVSLRRDSDKVILAVSDTGVGIPPDKLERVFDRFYQVDGSARRRYGGVGLGLALVKEIVEAYGGRVHVDSEVDAGSTFTAYIPIFIDNRRATEGRAP
jgi:signal transduction histidine kinase/DNA-binding LacI/PurR family transcriptional regulator/putative methionine-R-sulfoxide reductase with GAF domain